MPEALIKETILSLNLLFPDWNPRTERFLHKTSQSEVAEAAVDAPLRLHLSDFYYWQDRLADLHLASKSAPTTWRQMWTDDRNPLQWYTFWFAVAVLVLTLIFGIISSITASMQTRYAYESLQLTRAVAKIQVVCLKEEDRARFRFQ